MRTLVCAALGALPLILFLLFACRCLDQAQQSPKPASMVFTSGSAKQWLEKEQGQCLPAVLRDN
jgi:hypothetical protein